MYLSLNQVPRVDTVGSRAGRKGLLHYPPLYSACGPRLGKKMSSYT